MAHRTLSQTSTTLTTVDSHAPNTQNSPHSSNEKRYPTADKQRPSVAISHPTSNDTLNTVLFYDEPPPLNYTLKTRPRQRAIILWFTLLFLEAGILPLILFYSLYWGAHLSTTKNLAIITSLIGSVSGFKFAQRMWFLWFARDHVSRRPIGAGRWGVDFFQFILSLAMAAFFIPLIIGSSVTPGNPRIVAMALPCTMLVLTLPLLLTGLAPYRVRLPWRVSSFPARQPLPPLGYCYVEDVVAVDGGGRTEFREAWRTRYEESQPIRHLIHHLSLTWGLSGTLLAGALLAACWAAPSIDTAYGLGYGVPWLWALLCGAVSVTWVRMELRRERREWKGRPGGGASAGGGVGGGESGARGERQGEGAEEGAHRPRRLRIREGRFDPPAGPRGVGEEVKKGLEARRIAEWRDAGAGEDLEAGLARPEPALMRGRAEEGVLSAESVERVDRSPS